MVPHAMAVKYQTALYWAYRQMPAETVATVVRGRAAELSIQCLGDQWRSDAGNKGGLRAE